MCYSLSGRCIGTHTESISNCNSSIIGRISTIFLIVNHVPNRTLNPLCGNSNGLQDMCSYLPYLCCSRCCCCFFNNPFFALHHESNCQVQIPNVVLLLLHSPHLKVKTLIFFCCSSREMEGRKLKLPYYDDVMQFLFHIRIF